MLNYCFHQDERKVINEKAVAFAMGFREDPSTLWTDGSFSDGIGCAGAVVWYEKKEEENAKIEEGNREGQAVIEKRGMLRRGDRRPAGMKTYGQGTRSIRLSRRSEGWSSEAISMGLQQTAFDAEVAGIVRALEVIARQVGGTATRYRIFKTPRPRREGYSD